jgi:hypothetical protein
VRLAGASDQQSLPTCRDGSGASGEFRETAVSVGDAPARPPAFPGHSQGGVCARAAASRKKIQSTQRHKASVPIYYRSRRYGRFWLALRLPQDRRSNHILRSLIARPPRRAAAAVPKHVPNWSWTAIFPHESRTNMTFDRNLQTHKNCECPGQDDPLRFLTLTYDLFRIRF